MSSAHPGFDQLNDLLDQRVGAEDRRRLEAHLRECDTCAVEWERLRRTRELLRQAMSATEEVPPELQQKVSASIRHRPVRPAAAWQLAAAVAVLALLAFIAIIIRRSAKDFPGAAAHDYRAVASREVPLEFRTNDAAALQRWFDQRLDFPTRVLDLRMMQYELVGGRIDSIGSRRSALFVYRHASGALVICEMYKGRVDELPAGAERRRHGDIDFFIYQRAGANAVFWPEGGILCVLASEIPREELVSLAFAKAMKPVGG